MNDFEFNFEFIFKLFLMCSFIYYFVEKITRDLCSKRFKEIRNNLIMKIFGGLIGILVYTMYFFLKKYVPFILLMFFGCIIITGLELAAGILFNIKLKFDPVIWDYKNFKIKIFNKEIPLHFMGQINIIHSFGWFMISWPLFLLGDFLL